MEKDRIAALGTDLTPPPNLSNVIDARNKVVLPGFINCHAHLQQYFRGVYELIGEFFSVNLPLEGYRRPDDMEKLGPASCAEFIYGGCGGNANNFETLRECQAACAPDICGLRPDVGPCDAVIPRLFFNAQTGACERFIWGGCGGNENNFETREDCEAACP